MLVNNIDDKIENFLLGVHQLITSENKNVDENILSFRLKNMFNKRLNVRFKKIQNNINININNSNKEMNDNTDTEEQCIAVIKSGKNKGKLCNKSVYTGKYCKIHSKEEIVKDNIDDNFVTVDENEEDVKSVIVNTTPPQQENYKMVISVNKYNNFVYGDTGLVFGEDKRIVAKEGPNGEWLTLTETDIELCKKYKLRYRVVEHRKAKPESTKQIASRFSILSGDWED